MSNKSKKHELKNMKFLLMNPPLNEKELFTSSSKETASRIPPLGLGYLAAYLEREGHEVYIWDGMVERESWEKIANFAKSFDILGIHVLTSFAIRSYEFAKYLKEKTNKPIVLGGCHVSALPLEAMELPYVDYVVVGEGEETANELCKALEKKKSLKGILGLYYREKGKIKYNGPRPLISDLNTLPMPARHLFKWNLYKSSEARHASSKKDMAILTSRGCPFSCSYCSKDVTGKKVRNFSLDFVMREIKLLINKYGAQEITIWDETFTLDRKRVIEFCNLIKKEKLNITWGCSSRVDVVDEELLKIMAKHGCNMISYGVESGNPLILKSINKVITKEKVRSAMKWTKKAGIQTRGFFMVGLYGDTPKTIMETIRFAKELDPEIATFTMMVPLPNTLDYARACKQKNFQKEYWKYRMFPEFNFLDNPIYVPEGMTKKQLITLHKKAYQSFYFRPKFVIRQLMQIRSIKDLKRLLAGAKTVLKL